MAGLRRGEDGRRRGDVVAGEGTQKEAVKMKVKYILLQCCLRQPNCWTWLSFIEPSNLLVESRYTKYLLSL